MLNVNSFKGTVQTQSFQGRQPGSSNGSAFDIGSATAPAPVDSKLGAKLSLDFIYKKLREHNFITEDELHYLQKKVTNRSQLVDAVSKIKGFFSRAARAASLMEDGRLLPNGILVNEQHPGLIQELSHLTKWEVQTLEEAQGTDMSIGQIGLLVTTVARSKALGIINGELGLKDFAMLKSWFQDTFKPGTREDAAIEEMLQKLYDLLSKPRGTGATHEENR